MSAMKNSDFQVVQALESGWTLKTCVHLANQAVPQMNRPWLLAIIGNNYRIVSFRGK